MKMMTREEAINLLKLVANAIRAAVEAAGSHGAPGGVLYAACMAQGMSLSTFEQIMSGMVEAGVLKKLGQLYFAT